MSKNERKNNMPENYNTVLQHYRELADEIHQVAVEHGWWDTDRDVAEVFALIHSELSEALDEYRNGKPFVYYVVDTIQADGRVIPEIRTDWEDGNYRDMKPEGIAIELVDAVIRILDYVGKKQIHIEKGSIYSIKSVLNLSLPELVSYCHMYLSLAYREYLRGEQREQYCGEYYIAEVLLYIHAWLELNGYDSNTLIALKHEYNKTRPYRHGGKKC